MTPPVDVPAAHSMDSTWFAVDANGEVGFFETGESGALPTSGFPLGGEAGEFNVDALIVPAIKLLAKDHPDVAALLPEDEADLRDWVGEAFYEADDDSYALLRGLGIWVYSCSDVVATPYVRIGAVAAGRPLTQFPAAVREEFEGGALPVTFAAERRVQPGEFGPVESWAHGWVGRDGAVHGDGAEDVAQGLDEWPPQYGRVMGTMSPTSAQNGSSRTFRASQGSDEESRKAARRSYPLPY